MKAIILAAGEGSRLRPLTNNKPKCMVDLAGKPIIGWQLDTFKKCGVDKISVVAGFEEDVVNYPGVTKYVNPDYDSTNMVHSLFCAAKEFNETILISYGDIIYSEEVLRKLIDSEGELVIACDEDWLSYWQERFNNPLDDAETFVKNENGYVRSLGQKATTLDEIEGQFIGLVKVSVKAMNKLRQFYLEALESNEPENAWGSGRHVKKAYMTDLLNFACSQGMAKFNSINRGWFEVDSIKDLEIAKKYLENGFKGDCKQ